MGFYVFEVNGQTYRRMSHEFKTPEDAHSFKMSMDHTIKYKGCKLMICKVLGDINAAESLA